MAEKNSADNGSADNGRVLWVQAHPDDASLGHALVRSGAARLRESGTHVAISDLYAMNWNPVLSDADFGATPAAWLSRQRIIHAQRLLESTDLGLDRVAYESGFGSAAVLRQNFARVLGTTPTAYRARFSCTTDEQEMTDPTPTPAVRGEDVGRRLEPVA